MKKLYAVWDGHGSFEPGVYEGVWMDDVGPKVDGARAQKKRVDTCDEGYDCLDQQGFGWTRQLLTKAALLHHRC